MNLNKLLQCTAFVTMLVLIFTGGWIAGHLTELRDHAEITSEFRATTTKCKETLDLAIDTIERVKQ